MPFGILDDHKLDNVPGTALLSPKSNQPTTGDASELKRGTGKHAHIVLIPQPSDEPLDPVFLSGLSNTLFGLALSGYFVLAKEFGVSVNEVASSFSTSFAGTAVFMLVLIPASIEYGHRIVYLSQRSCLVANTIEHLYFVHERGSRSCLWVMCQGIGDIIGTLINSYIIQLVSWRRGFWFASIACGLSLVGVFLLVPETTCRRQLPPTHLQSRKKESENGEDLEDHVKKTIGTSPMRDAVENRDLDPHVPLPNRPSFLSQLRIHNGTFSDESVWRLFLRPFPFIFSPVTWFVFFSFSIPSVCLSFVAVCSSTIFTVTYGFSAGQIGLTNIGSMVGITLALITTGALNDWWVVWMARRNRGIYEPEYRLVFMLSLLVGAFGYVGWAVGNGRHMPWVGAVACLAMAYFSLVVSSATRIAYLIDTHGANSAHIIALTEFVQDLIIYGSTFFANGVVLSAGVRRTLLVVAGVQAACLLACVPMYVFGKRVRSFIARHPRLFQGHRPASESDRCSLAQSSAPEKTGPE